MPECTSALYVPTVHQETASASLFKMQAGRKLYVQNAEVATLYFCLKNTQRLNGNIG